jgi:hypothetical protein
MSLQCRICLEDDNLINLVSPCNCNGTSKYIHPHCLTTWRNQSIDTPYYNICIDCRTEYKFTVVSKESAFLNTKNNIFFHTGILGIITLVLSSFDKDASFKIFDSIKNKNITQIFNKDENNYYYIFYHIIIAHYLINIAFFMLSYLCLFRIINIKRYCFGMCFAKMYNIFKLVYIFILYVAFSIKLFLASCFLLVFVDAVSINLYCEKHNKILNDINIANINYYVDDNDLDHP